MDFAGFDFMSFLPIIALMVAFYFLLIRPQQKKAKDHQGMLASLRRGDEVVTSGGVIGTITKIVDDQELLVEISKGVNVRLMKSMVTQCINGGKGGSAVRTAANTSSSSATKRKTAASNTRRPRKTAGTKKK